MEKYDQSTTLDFSIRPERCPRNTGTQGEYFQLTYGPGYPCITRLDLVKKSYKKKSKKPKAIVTFGHITDLHIIDAASPSRVAFLSIFVREFPIIADSFRPYEAFSCQVCDQMVQRLNAIGKGPHLHQPIKLVVNTGDSADGQQINELTNCINLLDGGEVIPNTATPGKYVGVQDNTPNRLYPAYYHPDQPPPGLQPDTYKSSFGYPEFPGVLNSAAEPFHADGLKFPWYAVNGNHDVTKLGAYSLGFFKMFNLFDSLAQGDLPEDLGSKLIESLTPFQAKAFFAALLDENAEAAFEIIKNSNLREIPRSRARQQFNQADFPRAHFNVSKKPGPVGHGYTQENIDNNILYYSFELSEEILGISLDSCNWSANLEDPSKASNGGIGRWQIAWLEKELRKVHSCYYNDLGQKVTTNNCNRLVVIFCHHTIETMNNDFNSQTTFDPDPNKILGDEFVKILHRYPNVIALVNGHEHRNKITAFPKNYDCCKDSCRPNCQNHQHYGGFWEINTASHIDYPQQSRIIEIADNGDSTLSIFCTLVDHLSMANSGLAVFPDPSTDSFCDTDCDMKYDTDCDTGNTNCDTTKISRQNSSDLSYDFSKYTKSHCCQKKYTREEIASISRELSYNDPFIVDSANQGEFRLGKPRDRNVELLINRPF